MKSWFFSFVLWLRPRYRLVACIQAHPGAITVLAVSEDGILASGGKLISFVCLIEMLLMAFSKVVMESNCGTFSVEGLSGRRAVAKPYVELCRHSHG